MAKLFMRQFEHCALFADKSPHSWACLGGGSSVLVLVVGEEVAREGVGVGDGKWVGEES